MTVWKTAYDQRRPYLDLADAVRAVAFFIARDSYDGRVYNVVTRNATVRNVVDCIRVHVPSLQVDFVKSRIMNQLSYEVRSTRIEKLGFEIQGDMELSVRQTVELLRQSQTLS